MSRHSNSISKGFTIVELLIVMVVMGILAALAMSTFAGAQDKARVAKAKADIQSMHKAMRAALVASGAETLKEITGDSFTGSPCTSGDIRNLPKTHQCWVDYFSALDAIQAASGMPLHQFKEGDPWGSPFLIDENEGEPGTGTPPNCFREDWVASVGKNGTWEIDSNDDILIRKQRFKITSDCI